MAAFNMDFGILVTRGAVWLALTLYVAGEFFSAFPSARNKFAVYWWLNVAGCIFFLAHVVCAFEYFYGWSHSFAYADTARQTKELTGWDSGSGLYVNYLFALVWLSEVIWWRKSATTYFSRRPLWTWTVRVFFLFMICNGAFIFVRSHLRWYGLTLSVLLAISWLLRLKRNIDAQPAPKSS
jgi:hypothetical protein